MKAIRIETAGGPEVMRLEELADPTPGEGELLVDMAAAGVNFVDVYHRKGLYPRPLPLTLGQEGAGTVRAVGKGVTDLKAGDRVAWAHGMGTYAERALVPADRAVRIPDGVTPRVAAAAMLQGMTAHYLATSTFPLKHGHTCLVHAAAGGVGLLLCQIAKLRGARVIGTVSTEEKAGLAREAGADEVIRYGEQDFVAEVKRITGGKGVEVVYDSVGQSTFLRGFDCLAPRGMMVLFGQSSGPVAPVDPQLLNQKGSLFLTRPSLHHYTHTREELIGRARDVLGWVAAKKLAVRIWRELPLEQAAEAHRLLEGRKTTGKLLLTVQ